MGNDVSYWLLFWGIRAYLGKKVNVQVKYACRDYLRSLDRPWVCWLCNQNIGYQNRSVDHLIPLSFIKQQEWVGLMFDHRNMRPAHKLCNVIRGDDLSVLPESVVARIRGLGYPN